ncbi:hypothetical protein KIN20_031930 [Parelaphostrongylus tenuis]|uniref:Uncharacterized protein n=1 Tax=Parelaphostrongylus tenuis TaxID=148309 RepID=A0AAD5R6A8_PARTN|nr:hypothetical protein KIN20_031930 [Parelaphostrongylus tenuis]
MDYSLLWPSGITTHPNFAENATRSKIIKAVQMVHDLREQVVLQRFEDLRQNGPSGVGGTQLPPTSTGSSIDGHHPNGRLTSPGPPHLSSLSTHYCSLHIVSLSYN